MALEPWGLEGGVGSRKLMKGGSRMMKDVGRGREEVGHRRTPWPSVRGVALYNGDRRGGEMKKWTWGPGRGLDGYGEPSL